MKDTTTYSIVCSYCGKQIDRVTTREANCNLPLPIFQVEYVFALYCVKCKTTRNHNILSINYIRIN